MDTTALLSTKDQLAAQLRRKTPAQAQVNRVSFSTILSDSRDGAAAEIRRAERATTKVTSDAREAAQSVKPDRNSYDRVQHRTREVARDPVRAAENVADPVRPARIDQAGATESAKPASGDAPTDHQVTKQPRPANAGDQQANPGQPAQEGDPLTGQVSAVVPPTLRAQGMELPAQTLMAATQTPAAEAPDAALATPGQQASGQPATSTPQATAPVDSTGVALGGATEAGVALGGATEDGALPSLVAPLAKPTGHAQPTTPVQSAAPGPATSQDTSAETVSLVGALVGKTTARGQDRALSSPSQPSAPDTTVSAQAATATVPLAVPKAPATPLPAVDPTADVALPQPLTAGRPEIQEPSVRAVLQATGDGGRVMDGAVNGLAQPGAASADRSAVAAVAQALRPLTEGPAQSQIQLLADAAPAQPQAAVAMAPRIAPEPAPATLDGGRSIADPSVQNMTASSGSGASSSEAATRAAAAKLARPAAPPTPVAEQVAVRISKAIAEGADRIEIRLKPASLGHVRVAMEVGHDGRVLAVVTADRADTLDMLKQDSRSLERALQDAGLKADSNSLSFNLRGGDGRYPQGHEAATKGTDPAVPDDGNGDGLPPDVIDPSRFAGGTGLVDIHV